MLNNARCKLQGEIGDCWFLAALANLADDEDSFDRVVPAGQCFESQYCGIFRLTVFTMMD